MRIAGLGLHVTDRCNARCEHCAYHCAPEAAGVMSLDEAREYLRQVADHPVEVVTVSGGEPCLYFDLVEGIVQEAAGRGVPGIWLFTNAFWATTPTAASKRLARLKDVGLTRLCLSADGFHTPFVPVERVRLAIAAARELDLEIVLDTRFLGPPETDNDMNRETRRALGELGELEGVERWQGQPRYIGRAAEMLASRLGERSSSGGWECPGPWAGGTWDAPVGIDVDSWGEVTLCPGLSIGNAKISPLKRILAEYDPRKHAILKELVAGGPQALARMGQRVGYEAGTGFASPCHLCYEVRKFLFQRHPSELAPAICYGESRSPGTD